MALTPLHKPPSLQSVLAQAPETLVVSVFGKPITNSRLD